MAILIGSLPKEGRSCDYIMFWSGSLRGDKVFTLSAKPVESVIIKLGNQSDVFVILMGSSMWIKIHIMTNVHAKIHGPTVAGWGYRLTDY